MPITRTVALYLPSGRRDAARPAARSGPRRRRRAAGVCPVCVCFFGGAPWFGLGLDVTDPHLDGAGFARRARRRRHRRHGDNVLWAGRRARGERVHARQLRLADLTVAVYRISLALESAGRGDVQDLSKILLFRPTTGQLVHALATLLFDMPTLDDAPLDRDGGAAGAGPGSATTGDAATAPSRLRDLHVLYMHSTATDATDSGAEAGVGAVGSQRLRGMAATSARNPGNGTAHVGRWRLAPVVLDFGSSLRLSGRYLAGTAAQTKRRAARQQAHSPC